MTGSMIIFTLSILVSLAMFYLLGKIRDSSKRDKRMRSFYTLAAIMLGWTLFNAVTIIIEPEYFELVNTVKMIFVCIMPYASAWFLINFSESGLARLRVLRNALIIIPALDIFALITNPLHNLYFESYDYPRASVGPVWTVHLVFAAITMALIIMVFIRYIAKNVRRSPMLVLTGMSILVPFALNMLYSFSIDGFAYDIAPLGFFVTILCFYYFTNLYSKDHVSKLNNAIAEFNDMPELKSGVPEDAASHISKAGCRALNATRVGVWTTSAGADELGNLICYDTELEKHANQDNLNITSCDEYKKLLQTESHIIVSSTKKPNPLTPILPAYNPELLSVLDTPVRIDGRLVGVVRIEQDSCAEYPDKREWTDDELSFASSLAGIMTIALENNEHYEFMRRTETLMSNIPGLVYQCLNDPPEYTFTFVSKGSLALLGYTPEELLGNKAVRFLDIVHPDDLEGLKEENAATLAIGLPLETTFRVVMQDGTIKWIWERSRVVEYKFDGTPRLLEGFYTDITEQRRLEAAELANRTKSEFLANMSHEIRTPMSAVLGLTDLAIRNFPGKSTLNYLSSIKNAGHQLLSVINAILDISKVESGAVVLVQKKYNVHALIHDIATIINVRIGDKPVDFIIDDDPDLPVEMIGDETRIKQIIINMLTNAVKFTNKGHILLAINAEKCEKEGQYRLNVSVTDTGAGIRREDINGVFESFTHFDTRKDSSVEGTGLGLAISKNLVELMGGEVSVESTYGQGSCFSFYIIQTVEDEKPLSKLVANENRKAAVWKPNEVKANVLARKIKKLGADCEIIQSADDISKYTHVFFDASKMKEVADVQCPGTKLFAVARNFIDKDKITRNMEFIESPFTSILAARLLGINTGDQYTGGDEGQDETLQLHNVRLLVVDDFDINLVIAKETLSQYGGTVDIANTGAKAIEMIKANNYDLVFMDHMMPELDGVDVTKIIRAMPEEKYKKIPIVALTANVVGNVRDMFIKNGMNDFLAKPLEHREIERVLREYMPEEKLSYQTE